MPRPLKRPPDQADFYSAARIARDLGVQARTIQQWAAGGLVRCTSTAVTVNLYSRDDVAKVLAQRRGPATAAAQA
jgi:predicted site-specific integrase-resolvase